MYDDKEIEIYYKAVVLIGEVREALAAGTKHYRESDGKLLETIEEIIKTMYEEKRLILVPQNSSAYAKCCGNGTMAITQVDKGVKGGL